MVNAHGPSITALDAGRPRLVFVHGGCHGSWQWTHWQRWFADRGWSSLAVDWAHHDQEPGHRNTPEWLHRGLREVTGDVAAAVRAAGPAPILIGHSMGGFAALNHACSSGAWLTGLVLLTPVLPSGYGGEPVELEVDPDRPWGPPPPETARELFYSGTGDRLAAEYFRRLQPESPRAVWEATRWTLEVDTSALQVPTFVVGAERDLLTPAPRVRELAHGIGADYAELPGAGHGVTLDPGWQALAARIETWMAQQLSTENEEHGWSRTTLSG
ncbi:alpha/beta hydrolase [Sciscionella sediminilitoris]|uniref:alpha/beta hydrolase n=1 Tax=Sciscionella sediminilitoris TaxID=1445613 RepID=UPI0004DEDDF1|nr:alpha/beta hydrolase [Sciscionella sp. SE31]